MAKVAELVRGDWRAALEREGTTPITMTLHEEHLACPACGTAMRPVPDLLHRAMARALDQAGSVEAVHGHAARDAPDIDPRHSATRYHDASEEAVDRVQVLWGRPSFFVACRAPPAKL